MKLASFWIECLLVQALYTDMGAAVPRQPSTCSRTDLIVSCTGNGHRTLPSGLSTEAMNMTLTGFRFCSAPPLTQFENLEFLNLKNNKIHRGTSRLSSLKKLKHLILSNNEITALNKGDFPLGNLEYLNLEYNKIKTINSEAFDSLTKLEDLRLEGNNIAYLGWKIFSSLTNLRSLGLADNGIDEIGWNTFSQLTNLTFLNLRGNRIRTIDIDAFRGSTQLETINLENNTIRTLNRAAFHHIAGLKNIYLRNNPLECENCTNYLFRLWINEKPTNVGEARCSKSQRSILFGNTSGENVCRIQAKSSKCHVCERKKPLNDQSCSKLTQCHQGYDTCKTDYMFETSGNWRVVKSCATSDCMRISQSGFCEEFHKWDSDDITCSSCCTMPSDPEVPCNFPTDISNYLESDTIMGDVIHNATRDINVTMLLPDNPDIPGVWGVTSQELNDRVVTFTGEVTHVRGLLHKVTDAVENIINQYWGSYIVSITMWNKDKCPESISVSQHKGNYTWPKTRVNTNATVPCIAPNGAKATRRCRSGPPPYNRPEWSEPYLKDCDTVSRTSQELDKLTKTVITEENAVDVVNTLSDITTESESLSTDDVAMTEETVTNVVDSDSSFTPQNQDNTAQGVLQAISNLCEVESKTIQESNASKKLIDNVQKLTKKLKVSRGEKLSYVESNVAISVLDTTTGKAAEGLTFAVAPGSEDKPFSNASVYLDYGASSKISQTHISLPGSVFKSSDASRVEMVVYRQNTLFKAMQDDGNGATQTRSKLNSMIISASLDKKITGLTDDPVKLSFQHMEPKKDNEKARCVWWDFTLIGGKGNWSGEGCSATNVESPHKTECACTHLTNFALLMYAHPTGGPDIALTIISITGCTLSALALMFTIFTYLYFHRKLLKDNPSRILLNLCFALLGLNIVFLGGTHHVQDDVACKVVAVLLHYFLIAAFSWMGIEAFYMYLALVKVFRPYFSKLILKLSIFGWGAPLVIVIVTLAINKSENYGLIYEQICWIKLAPFYGAIVTPIAVVLLLNIVAFCLVAKQIHSLTKQKQLTKTSKTSTATQLRGTLSVFVLLGLTWLFAFLAITRSSYVFTYLFAILNTLQGVWLFIFYCLLKKDVTRAWKRFLPCCPTPEDSKTSKGKDSRSINTSKSTGYTTASSFASSVGRDPPSSPESNDSTAEVCPDETPAASNSRIAVCAFTNAAFVSGELDDVMLESKTDNLPQEDETKPTQEEDTKPVQEEDTKPAQEEDTKPVQEEDTKPAQEEDTKPVKEEDTKPAQEEDTKPVKEEDTKPAKEEEEEKTEKKPEPMKRKPTYVDSRGFGRPI